MAEFGQTILWFEAQFRVSASQQPPPRTVESLVLQKKSNHKVHNNMPHCGVQLA